MQEAPFWVANGWIHSLRFTSAYDLNDIFPAMRKGLSNQCILYAASIYGESSIVIYRSDLADAAAVQINDSDSWDNIELAASAIQNPDKEVYGIGSRGKPGWGDNIALFTTIANSFGATWIDADFRPLLDSVEWNRAVNFYVDLLTNYGPPNSEESSYNEVFGLFKDGSCGI